MDLSLKFAYRGWNIMYGVFEPQTLPQNPKTVLFVHGTPWSSGVFNPLVRALLSTERYRVVLYDLAGYGRSQHNPSWPGHNEGDDALELFKQDMKYDTSVQTQASALAALIGYLNLPDPPAVIAHDIAGAIVLRAHLLHSVDFASMMLLETNTVLPWGDGFYKLARSRPEAFVEMPPSIFEAVVRAVIRSGSHDPHSFSKKWEDALAEPWIGEKWRQRSFVRQIAQANDRDVKEMLDQELYAKVRCDVKIMWGESDSWIPREKMERLAEMLRSKMKGFVTVPEAGHLVMIDQPKRVAVEVLEWLSSS